jgi:hypothetical protein
MSERVGPFSQQKMIIPRHQKIILFIAVIQIQKRMNASKKRPEVILAKMWKLVHFGYLISGVKKVVTALLVPRTRDTILVELIWIDVIFSLVFSYPFQSFHPLVEH